MKKLLAVLVVLAMLLSLGAAFADEYYDLSQNPGDYPYEPEQPPLKVVNCKEWISVWSDTDKSYRMGILPLGSTILFWMPYNDDFIYFDLVGDGGFVSWDYLEYIDSSAGINPAGSAPAASSSINSLNDSTSSIAQAPLYVVNCKDWASVWSEPSNQSVRLDTLPRGTCIGADQWAPYNDDYIWFNMGSDGGYVSWDYLGYNP